jgi:hypothetical protein
MAFSKTSLSLHRIFTKLAHFHFHYMEFFYTKFRLIRIRNVQENRTSAFTKPLLLWKSNKYYILVCVCAFARVCMVGWPEEWACVSASMHVELIIQHAMRLRHIVFLFVASLAPPLFRHYLINDRIFEKTLLNVRYKLWFSLQDSFKIFLLLRRIERDIVIHVETSACKMPVILVRL